MKCVNGECVAYARIEHATVMMMAAHMFKTNPTRIICFSGTRPVANTNALGGVPTGNMNA